MVTKRDKAEKLLGEYGRGRIIERIDYHNITIITNADLDKYLSGEDRDMEPFATPFISTTTVVEKCPLYSHYKEATVKPAVNDQLCKVY